MKDYEEDLKENYNIRIALNISNILDEDLTLFNQKTRNDLINKIISSYLEVRSTDDISTILYNEIKEKFSKNFNKNDLKDVETLLREEIYKTTFLKSKADSKILNFRLNNKTRIECKKLKKPQEYFDTKFFRAIFEWYTSKAKYQREAILFNEFFEKLKDAIENKYEVILKVKGQKKDIYAKPVGYFSTKEENYNYILTIGKDVNTGVKRIFPTRLSNILSVDLNPSEKFDISYEDRKKVDKKIEKKNYTWSEVQSIKIRFTDAGLHKYETIQHLRPKFVDKIPSNNNTILTFEESPDIIFYYFIQFGEDLEILEPLSLREKFKEFYKKSFEIYMF